MTANLTSPAWLVTGEPAGHGPARSDATNRWGPRPAIRLADPFGHGGDLPGGTHHCPMLAIDVSAFNDPKRGEDVQRFLRTAMYEMLVRGLGIARLPWPVCYHEDRGDGVLVVAPPGVPAARLIDPLVDHLRADLRRHNKICSDLAALRLRMSVHAGYVHFDRNGVCGYAVTHLFRMLDAAAVKRVFAGSGSDFALVTSDALYEDVISHGPGLIDPAMYAPINIRCKETRSRAWLYLPPVRNPVLRMLNGRGSQPATSRGRARSKTAKADPGAAARPQEPASPSHSPASLASVPRPRVAGQEEQSEGDGSSARAGLIAAGREMPTPDRLGGGVGGPLVRNRLPGRRHPGQRRPRR